MVRPMKMLFLAAARTLWFGVQDLGCSLRTEPQGVGIQDSGFSFSTTD